MHLKCDALFGVGTLWKPFQARVPVNEVPHLMGSAIGHLNTVDRVIFESHAVLHCRTVVLLDGRCERVVASVKDVDGDGERISALRKRWKILRAELIRSFEPGRTPSIRDCDSEPQGRAYVNVPRCKGRGLLWHRGGRGCESAL